MANYQPFGRAGGGAPLKDQAGNVYSMLRSVMLLQFCYVRLCHVNPNALCTVFAIA